MKRYERYKNQVQRLYTSIFFALPVHDEDIVIRSGLIEIRSPKMKMSSQIENVMTWADRLELFSYSIARSSRTSTDKLTHEHPSKTFFSATT